MLLNTYYINFSLGNPSIEILENIDYYYSGTHTLNYTKGSGLIYGTGAAAGTQTYAFNNHSIEGLIINDSGATKQFTEPVTVQSFSGVAGTVDHNGQDMTVVGSYILNDPVINNANGLNGMALTIGGNYSIIGSAVTQILLNASAGWTLNVTGNGSTSYVTVKNSDASGGSTIMADDNTCMDQGNNLNWDFYTPGSEIMANLGLIIGIGVF